jgi:hypothetical protein
MSEPAHKLPLQASFEQLQKQAKELLREDRAGDAVARQRFRGVKPEAANSDFAPTLADSQFVLAREYGFETWAKLKQHFESLPPAGFERYEQLARELASAYSAADVEAIRRINWDYGTSFVSEREADAMHRRLKTWFASTSRSPELALADSRNLVAHSYGFESWPKFAASAKSPDPEPRSAPLFISRKPPFYKIDWDDNRLSVRGPQSERDWQVVIDVMKQHGVTKLEAGGMTDGVMALLPQLDQLTTLHIEGSKDLTDDGAMHLTRMPQLQDLDLGGPTSRLTDRALEPLKQLRHLRRLKSCWTPGISDAGLAHLASCERIEEVNIMGTPTGDGAIRALAGKPHLHRFSTGRNVTDAGLALLHEFPVFKSWQGGEPDIGLMSFASKPNHLLLDGPFTDAGLAGLVGLDGLLGLSFFWHCPAFTSAGLEPLRLLPQLGFLGCQAQHCDDAAMRHIALPHLRMLMGQGAVASDVGFEALSRSKTIEYFWGRECPNLGSRGFLALSTMESLRGLGASLKNVDDAALSSLPRFASLTQLMPMDVSDAGFYHVGKIENLEGLWCMYCRDTGDIATEHLPGLTRLKNYYSGMTRITDRSLQILSQMHSLEKLEFWQCADVTDAGVGLLAHLPRLREISIDLPNVSRKVISLFPRHVRVQYWG